MKIAAWSKFVRRACVAAGFFLFGASALAGPINLVKNGGFELNRGTGQLGVNTSMDHWTSTWGGFNFVFEEGAADTTGAKTWWTTDPLASELHLWGANNGGANALASSQDGGSFVAVDGAYTPFGLKPIEQMISGLVVGQKYVLSFEWAAAQQHRFHGVTSEKWSVTLGDSKYETATYTNASHASSSWMQEAFIFTATKSEALLSFLAAGTPAGHPPFSLLDGVSLTTLEPEQQTGLVPEPSTVLILLVGGAAMLLARRRRQARPQ